MSTQAHKLLREVLDVMERGADFQCGIKGKHRPLMEAIRAELGTSPAQAPAATPKIRLTRVERGYYKVDETSLEIVNLTGASVRYPSNVPKQWLVRTRTDGKVGTLSRHDTKADAVAWVRENLVMAIMRGTVE